MREKSVSVRLPRAMARAMEQVMRERGVLKASDFVRQAVQREIRREKESRMMQPAPLVVREEVQA
jgi:metal-responsive CopG/Arc/MetJ family transcriptional regulator